MSEAIGLAYVSKDLASVKQSANQLLIRSVRFLQVEPVFSVRVTPQ